MKGILSHGGGKGGEKAPEGAGQDETEDLSPDEGSLLMSMISQLRPGMDLSRITFPTFVLEPRSMLERITDFLAHPDLIFGAGKIEDANERFIAVMTYYLAGWHIKPKGVKKPYNPVLGEIFRCRFKYQDGSQGFYIAEQVSHHPPISAFYYCSPENKIEIFGELKPKSKFLGNSAANEMGGFNHIVLLDRPEDGEYDISMPNMYARGILFGKMVLELGDVAKVSNSNTNIYCDVEFKTKGFFSGTYNAIGGKIKSTKGELGEVSGKWSDQMYLQRGKHGEKEQIFDAAKAVAVPKTVAPEADQDEFESRRLWSKVTQAIKKNDQDAATEEKSAIEDRQRDIAKQREDNGEKWKPAYFAIKKDEHRAIFTLPKGDVKEQIRAVDTWIFGKPEGGEIVGSESENSSSTIQKVDGNETSAPPPAQKEAVAKSSNPEPSAIMSPTMAAAGSASSSTSTTSTKPTATRMTPSNSTSTNAPAPQPAQPPRNQVHHSKPIAMAEKAVAAMGLGDRSGASSGASSPESHLSFFKGRRKTVSKDFNPSSAPDHEASSRNLP